MNISFKAQYAVDCELKNSKAYQQSELSRKEDFLKDNFEKRTRHSDEKLYLENSENNGHKLTFTLTKDYGMTVTASDTFKVNKLSVKKLTEIFMKLQKKSEYLSKHKKIELWYVAQNAKLVDLIENKKRKLNEMYTEKPFTSGYEKRYYEIVDTYTERKTDLDKEYLLRQNELKNEFKDLFD